MRLPHTHKDSHLHPVLLVIFHWIFMLVHLFWSRRTWEGQSIVFKILEI